MSEVTTKCMKLSKKLLQLSGSTRLKSWDHGRWKGLSSSTSWSNQAQQQVFRKWSTHFVNVSRDGNSVKGAKQEEIWYVYHTQKIIIFDKFQNSMLRLFILYLCSLQLPSSHSYLSFRLCRCLCLPNCCNFLNVSQAENYLLLLL